MKISRRTHRKLARLTVSISALLLLVIWVQLLAGHGNVHSLAAAATAIVSVVTGSLYLRSTGRGQ